MEIPCTCSGGCEWSWCITCPPSEVSMLLGREEEEGGEEDEDESLLAMELRLEWLVELLLELDLCIELKLDSVPRASMPKAGKVVMTPGVTPLTPVSREVEIGEYMAGSLTPLSWREQEEPEETGVGPTDTRPHPPSTFSSVSSLLPTSAFLPEVLIAPLSPPEPTSATLPPLPLLSLTPGLTPPRGPLEELQRLEPLERKLPKEMEP